MGSLDLVIPHERVRLRKISRTAINRDTALGGNAPFQPQTTVINGNADAAGGYLPVVCTLNAAKVTDTFARILGVDHPQLSRLALAAPASDFVTGAAIRAARS